MWITVGVLFGSALVMAVMTLSFQKAFTIFGTALYGGAVLAGALDYYVEKFAMVLWMWDRVKLEEINDLCWFSWLLLGVWPFMLVVGIITQTFITGRDFYHDYQGLHCWFFFLFIFIVSFVNCNLWFIRSENTTPTAASCSTTSWRRTRDDATVSTKGSSTTISLCLPGAHCPRRRHQSGITCTRNWISIKQHWQFCCELSLVTE